MNWIQKISAAAAISLISAIPVVGIAHAQTNLIGSTFTNAVNSSKETAVKNSQLRNQLVSDHSADVQNKEEALADQLNLNILNLENIQTRIAAKTAETAASGTDTSAVDAWLASSSQDIVIAQNDVTVFASSIATSTNPSDQIAILKARKLADVSIDAVNAAHDDLQSALDALTNIL